MLIYPQDVPIFGSGTETWEWIKAEPSCTPPKERLDGGGRETFIMI